MATVQGTHIRSAQSPWSNFTAAEREAMKREDSIAFGIVSGLLVAIVTLGFVLIATTLCTILLI
jgi:hypothetical protein